MARPCAGAAAARRRTIGQLALLSASAGAAGSARSTLTSSRHRGRVWLRHRPASCSSATSSARSAGARCWSACRSCASATTPTFVVVNAENVAGGLGITPKAARALFAGGVDAITLGNHTYHRREIYPYLDSEPRILRPANFLRIQPGHGTCVIERDGLRLGVVNLSGNLYLQAGRSAFTEIETALGELGDVDHILVDMHAEATSEKVALGWMLDGRVTAVVGTHTHIPTADARVLPGGTAYITDVGMTGPRGGVIGVKREQAIESLRDADARAL